MKKFNRNKVLAVAAGGYGLYSAAKGAWNLSNNQGCKKCETTGIALGIGLTLLAGWVLVSR